MARVGWWGRQDADELKALVDRNIERVNVAMSSICIDFGKGILLYSDKMMAENPGKKYCVCSKCCPYYDHCIRQDMYGDSAEETIRMHFIMNKGLHPFAVITPSTWERVINGDITSITLKEDEFDDYSELVKFG